VKRPGLAAIATVSLMALTTTIVSNQAMHHPELLTEDVFQTAFVNEWVKISYEDQANICTLYYRDRTAIVPMFKRDFEANTGLTTDPDWYRSAFDQACDYTL